MLLLGVYACDDKKAENTSGQTNPSRQLNVPSFSADSAFQFVAKQVSFGPRNPNSKGHRECGDYIVATLKQYGAEVIEQKFVETAFTGEKLDSRNIIASFFPKHKKRILLAAHWDTRPFADQDTFDTRKPILGANDGGSGVGVLLELARIFADTTKDPGVGVDIIFFDAEDFGDTDDYQNAPGEEPGRWWCLGSKYWANNPHTPNYSAYFGILLDMVGGRNARFGKEGISLMYAPSVVQRVWSTGQRLGFQQYFIDKATDGITDDHVFVNRIAKINMIDIIEYDPSSGNYFNKHWHRHSDNLENIDPQTLKAVGQTLLQVLYEVGAE